MARIRTVKPELADDEKLGSISRDARLLFIMMWCHSDDYGVVKGNLRWLQAQIFPYDPIKPEQFKKWVDELINIDAIRPYEKKEEKYFYIKNFQKHQVINKPSKQARNPDPPEEVLRGDSRSTTVALPEDYAEEGKGREGKGKEGKGKEGNAFEIFWEAYPKKKSKGQAEKEWLKIKPSEQLLADILATIERAKTSEDWMKEGGRYIPYPATWLNAKGWEDEFLQGAPNASNQERTQYARTKAGGVGGDTSRFENTAEKFD